MSIENIGRNWRNQRRFRDNSMRINKVEVWLMALSLMGAIYLLSAVPDLVFFDSLLPDDAKKAIQLHSIKMGTGDFFSYSFSLHPDFLVHKLGHILLYGLLGIFLFAAIGAKRSLLWVSLVVTFYAVGDEFHQAFVPGRYARLGDIMLDVLSAVVAVLLVRKFFYKKHEREAE